MLRRFRSTSVAIAIVFSSDAQAHNRIKETSGVTFDESGDKTLVRTTFGLLISTDKNKTWDFVCAKNAGYDWNEDPVVARATGAWLVGAGSGLARSTDDGCTFETGLLDGRFLIGVHASGELAWAVTTRFVSSTSKGIPQYESRLHRSLDSGAHWSAVPLPFEPAFVPTGFLRAETGELYVSGARRIEDGSGLGLLYRSNSNGVPWEASPVPLTSEELMIAILGALGPRVVVRTTGNLTERILESTNYGQTFAEVHAMRLAQAWLFQGDASMVGSSRDGLYVRPALAGSFAKASAQSVQCLHALGNSVVACLAEGSGAALGRSTDLGKTFEPMLRLRDVRGIRRCNDLESLCASDWTDIQIDLGITAAPDAGTEEPLDAGAVDSGPTDFRGTMRGGCATQPSPARGAFVWLAFAATLAIAIRRKNLA